MAGTVEGGKKAAKKNLEKYGADFYTKIGAKGGGKSRSGGFTNRDLARRAGALGGAKSRRRKSEKSL